MTDNSKIKTERVTINVGGRHHAFHVRSHNVQGDRDVINEVVVGDCYGIRSMELNPRVIFDIGAHIGTASRMLRVRFPDARILAFEPSEESFTLLQMNCEGYGIECYRYALRYEDRPILVSNNVATGGNHLLTRSEYGTVEDDPAFAGIGLYLESEDVPSLTFEEMFERFNVDTVDLLKIDCEGGEMDALEHMTDEAAARIVGPIVGEYHCVLDHDAEDGWEAFKALAERRWPGRRYEPTSPHGVGIRWGTFRAFSHHIATNIQA